MTSLTNHQSNDFVKLLLLGDAKSGKTTALWSLAAAGYKLRILDMDNLLDGLAAMVRERCPDKLDQIEFRTLRDKRKMTDTGPMIDGPARTFVNATKMLDRWKYDDVDLGVPGNWGSDTILVIDSLSRLCDAAFDWREPLTPRGRSGEYDRRATYKDAQDAIESMLAMLTSKTFETNVIVICHGLYMELEDGTTKIFPQGVGAKLSPKIPQYFPVYVRFKNLAGRRTIQLTSDPMIDLATPAKIATKKTLDSDGLAELFEALKGSVKQQEEQTPIADTKTTVVHTPRIIRR